MSVFTLEYSAITNEPVLIPLNEEETESIYNMLAIAFPLKYQGVYGPIFKHGYICCWNGYENAIAFNWN